MSKRLYTRSEGMRGGLRRTLRRRSLSKAMYLLAFLGQIAYFYSVVGSSLSFKLYFYSMVAAVMTLGYWLDNPFRRLLRRLKETKGKACLSCAYDLRDLADKGRCPECGQAYRLSKTLDVARRIHGNITPFAWMPRRTMSQSTKPMP